MKSSRLAHDAPSAAAVLPAALRAAVRTDAILDADGDLPDYDPTAPLQGVTREWMVEQLQGKVHPCSEIFPLMHPDEFLELAEDIRARGLLEDILIDDVGLIIDGRNRFLACLLIGDEPRFKWADELSRTASGIIKWSITDYIISMNLQRRHLTSGQKAAIATETLNCYESEARERQRAAGGDRKSEGAKGAKNGKSLSAKNCTSDSGDAGRAIERAAKATGTNRTYLIQAKQIKEQSPEIFEKLRNGAMTMQQAAQTIRPASREIHGTVTLVPREPQQIFGHITVTPTHAEIMQPKGLKGLDVQREVAGLFDFLHQLTLNDSLDKKAQALVKAATSSARVLQKYFQNRSIGHKKRASRRDFDVN